MDSCILLNSFERWQIRHKLDLPEKERLERQVMASQTILVTGAAGFLGSHLLSTLLAEGHTVIGVNNLSTGKIANLDHLSSESRFRFLEQDITRAFDPGLFSTSSTLPRLQVQWTTRLGIETLLVGSAGTINTA